MVFIQRWLRNVTFTGGTRKEKISKMSAIESTGTRSGTQKQYGNMKKFVGHFFFFSKKKTCAKRKMEIKRDG